MAQHDAQGLGSSADQVDATDGGGGMGGRSEEFTREISQLKLSGSSADTEARALKLGIAGLAIPIVMAIVGILLVMSTSDAGAALFIRYSFGRYLRFWMIRLIHEQRAQTDRVVEALERTSARND